MLIYDVAPLSLAMEESKKKGQVMEGESFDTLTPEAKENVYFDDSMALEKGIVVGIMSFLKERKKRHIASLADDPSAKAEAKYMDNLEAACNV